MNQVYQTVTTTTDRATMNKVLKNTYALLSLTLLFSAGVAWFAVAQNWPPLNIFVVLGGFFGLLFVTTKLRNSVWGLAAVFAFTGFLGATIGPIINFYLTAFSNGGQIVTMALAGTGAIFLGLSGYAMTTKRDFSFMRGFLAVAILVAFLAGLAAIFFELQVLSLAVSGAFVLLMSGLILYETQQIVRGGETNYIMATTTLFISIFNLFSSLLHLLGFALGDD